MTIATRIADYVHPRVAAVYENSAAEAEFWQWVTAHGAPLIEADPASADHSLVTHVWQTCASERYVVVQPGCGDAPGNLMTRIPGTGLCFASYRMRNDLRTSYSFAPDMPLFAWDAAEADDLAALNEYARTHPPRHDPLHREFAVSRAAQGQDETLTSILSLPAAPDESLVAKRPQVARGALQKHEFTSELLGNTRRLWVYTPPGYEMGSLDHPVLVAFDGGVCVSQIPMHRMLDNLLADGRIRATVAVFIDNVTATSRNVELPCNETFARFIDTELLPWLRANHRVSRAPADHFVAGASYGGLAAMWLGYRLPHVFGNVISQAASLWWGPGYDLDVPRSAGGYQPEWLTGQFENAPRSAVRFWMEIGLLEHGLLMRAPNRRMHALLQRKGYDVVFSEPCGGHDTALWRGTMAQALAKMLA